LGLGWVSIFDPQALAGLLGFPHEVRPIAILCLGHVERFYTAPMLVQEGWREPRPLAELLYENGWAESGSP
jgi:5,6-dimethylbenzimidazole synthase